MLWLIRKPIFVFIKSQFFQEFTSTDKMALSESMTNIEKFGKIYTSIRKRNSTVFLFENLLLSFFNLYIYILRFYTFI